MSGMNFMRMFPVVRIGGVDPVTYKDSGKDVEFLSIGFYVDNYFNGEEKSERFEAKLFNRKSENAGDRVSAFKKMYTGDDNKGRKVQLELVPTTRMVERVYSETVDVTTLETWVAEAKKNGGELQLNIPYEYKAIEFVVRDFQPVDPPRTAGEKKVDGPKKVGIQIGAPKAKGENPPVEMSEPKKAPF